ncbi:MAG: ribosome biogenesis GTPase YlqF, partial [Pseudomonadota bacterium]|nr:ribosome biogenesis GTPase YlqF [Pseudomonadota bacterium]
HYADNVQQRYQFEQMPHTEFELLEAIGAKRGCLRKGGEVDLLKVSKLFISELRSGTLGRITLETPAMMEQEMAEVAVLRQKKAAKKARRRSRR